MPAQDTYHEIFKNALIKQGWKITHDPYKLTIGGRKLFIDLGAERLVAAEKGELKIAVEIKSFLYASMVRELELSLGQYSIYKKLLEQIEPDRILYLAIPNEAFESIFREPLGDIILNEFHLSYIKFNTESGDILDWSPKTF